MAGPRPGPAQPGERRGRRARGCRPVSSRLAGRDVTVGEDGVRLADGTLAGSALSLDEAVRNLIAFTGCSVSRGARHGHLDPGPGPRPGLARASWRPASTPTSSCSPRDLQVVGTIVGGREVHRSEEVVPVEVVIVESAAELGSIVADAIEALLDRKPDAVLGLATGSSPVPVYDELVGPVRSWPDLVRAGSGVPAGRVRRPAARPSGVATGRSSNAPSPAESTSLPAPCMGPDGNACDLIAACARLRIGHRFGGRRRPPAPRCRSRRPHRLQRARLVPRLPHAAQDADQPDQGRQRPLLRVRRRRAAPCPDPGHRHHPRRPPPRARGVRLGQG